MIKHFVKKIGLLFGAILFSLVCTSTKMGTNKHKEAIEKVHLIFISPENVHQEVKGSNENLAQQLQSKFPSMSKTEVHTHFVSISSNQGEDLEGAQNEIVLMTGQSVNEQIENLVNSHQIGHFILFSPTNFHKLENGLKATYDVSLIRVSDQAEIWQSHLAVQFKQEAEQLMPQEENVHGFIEQMKKQGLIM